MAERYFEKFPTITYANSQVKDITERVVFTDNTLNNPYAFYPYDLDNQERPDQFADKYYGDSYYTWLLYLGNKVTDPYYEWYLTEEELNRLIEKKYGSIEIAQTKIKYYRNNWPVSDPISISTFDALTAVSSTYWEPQYGVAANKVGYSRKKDDTIFNTNSIRSYALDSTSSGTSNSFILDEICKIDFDGIHVGHGQLLSIKGNTIYIHHTSGTTLANTTVHVSSSSYIYGTESGANVAFASNVDSLGNVTFIDPINCVDNFQPEEVVYYSPVSYYDFEREKNEFNKTIDVLDSTYAKEMAVNQKKLLK